MKILVTGIFLRQALAGQTMSVFGDGRQTRAFSHIDGVAPGGVVARMTGWVRKNGVPEPTPSPAVEITQNLPEGWA